MSDYKRPYLGEALRLGTGGVAGRSRQRREIPPEEAFFLTREAARAYEEIMGPRIERERQAAEADEQERRGRSRFL